MRTYKVETEQGEFTVEEMKEKPTVDLEHKKGYTRFYQVRAVNGLIVFWLGRGHYEAPTEVVGWYRKSKKMHYGYGKTFKEAVELLIRDGWKYA